MSRNRTNAIDSTIVVPNANSTSAASTTGTTSQLSRGRAPDASRKISTGTRFRPRLNTAVMTLAMGTASRGKSTLRTRLSRITRLRTPCVVASLTNENSTMPSSSATGKYLTPVSSLSARLKTTNSTPKTISGFMSCQR